LAKAFLGIHKWKIVCSAGAGQQELPVPGEGAGLEVDWVDRVELWRRQNQHHVPTGLPKNSGPFNIPYNAKENTVFRSVADL
jgi:hypothetical protein